jgi:DinB superfamily
MDDRKALLMFLLFASFLNAQTPAAEQQPKQVPGFMGPCANLVCEVENDWSRNNLMLYGLANSMPEDKFGYKPTPAQQTFGERVLHVAQVNLMLLQALGAKTPMPVIDMNAISKAASMDALQRVGGYGIAVIKELGEQGLLARIDSPGPVGWFMGPQVSRQRVLYFLMTHSQDTYGQLVVYARMNGITPPASRQP